MLLVFASSTAVTSIAFLRGPAIPQVSIVGGVLLAVSAVVDRHSSPGGAVVTGALAASAILIGVGALSGRCSDQDLDSRAANSPTTSS